MAEEDDILSPSDVFQLHAVIATSSMEALSMWLRIVDSFLELREDLRSHFEDVAILEPIRQSIGKIEAEWQVITGEPPQVNLHAGGISSIRVQGLMARKPGLEKVDGNIERVKLLAERAGKLFDFVNEYRLKDPSDLDVLKSLTVKNVREACESIGYFYD